MFFTAMALTENRSRLELAEIRFRQRSMIKNLATNEKLLRCFMLC